MNPLGFLYPFIQLLTEISRWVFPSAYFFVRKTVGRNQSPEAKTREICSSPVFPIGLFLCAEDASRNRSRARQRGIRRPACRSGSSRKRAVFNVPSKRHRLIVSHRLISVRSLLLKGLTHQSASPFFLKLPII